MLASRDNFPLLDELLAEQQRLDTPVARFSAAHEAGASAIASTHAALLPLSAPAPGEQYAFEVDLDACTGCKSCVAACHSLNGLDETETWRDVGLLVSDEPRHPFTQTVTTACHHCADPACLNGCPVLAYEKDPITGIVRHLDDQCIGCSYCVLKCPYDVPKFSRRLGIVRKCDMCHHRLAAGEAPACAQACPTHAIRIVTVNTTEPNRAAKFLPAAPDASYTQPTTRYVSRRGLPANVVAADAATLRPQPAHWPLVVMLTLIPQAVGCSWAAALAELASDRGGSETLSFGQHISLLAVVAGAAGLAASVLHLGQPRRAWRIFLGWRTSWLSREAMLFAAWFPAAGATLFWRHAAAPSASIGTVALFCSAMIYVDTRRVFWRFGQTLPRFFGAALVLGLAAALAFNPTMHLALALLVGTLAKLAVESRVLAPLHVDRDRVTPARNTALLLRGALRDVHHVRVLCAALGGVFAPIMVVAGLSGHAAALAAWGFTCAGELLERLLFFRAVDAPKMPGMPT